MHNDAEADYGSGREWPVEWRRHGTRPTPGRGACVSSTQVTRARAAIAGVILAGPAVLAFFSGGYFNRPLLWAGIVVWVCVALAACVSATAWPRTRTSRLALGGLGLLTAWTIISIGWAPLRDAAQADAQRALLYLGALLAGTAALRQRSAARAAEPVLAFGALIVICEGLSERVLPGLFTLAHNQAAAGRLDQPFTYWNAVGIVAAIAFVLLVRLAGDPTRPPRLRLAAVVAGPPVALGLYLTLSRGSLLAAAIGLAVLVLLAPTREQGRTMVLMILAALPAIGASLALSGVRTLQGSLGSRERDGVVLLCLLAVSMMASAAVTSGRRFRRRSASAPDMPDATIRRIAGAGGIVVALVTAVVFLAAATSRVTVDPRQSATASSARLVTTDTIRGNFWRVALTAFGDHPVGGVGAGGFETIWGRHRTLLYYARDAHSLYLETLSELGIIGALALMALLAGVAASARRAYRLDPGLSAGWIAAISMWVVHAGLDWDWEMPAVSLLGFVLVAAILARADEGSLPPRLPVAVRVEADPVSAGVRS